jgi:hypothetical protein
MITADPMHRRLRVAAFPKIFLLRIPKKTLQAFWTISILQQSPEDLSKRLNVKVTAWVGCPSIDFIQSK